jgi:alpha-beta hydrolase superfamily lysophospholipase
MSASPQFPKLPNNWNESFLTCLNGSISIRLYQSSNLKKGRLLFLVHGQGEQSDRYEHFPHYLNGLVDAIACVDLPGHGKSSGQRGHIENFDQYQEAVMAAFQTSTAWMTENAGRCEAHWFAHSMGGLISLRCLLKETNLALSSVSISAPLLDLAFPVPKLKKFFGELVEPILGSLKLSNELDSTLVSHDLSVQKAYIENPLNHNFVSPRFFVNMSKEMKLVRENQGPFHYHLLMLIAGDDKIVSAKASYEFFRNLKIADGKIKSLTSFPGFAHESFNEIAKERAFTALSEWLEKRARTF